MDKSKHVVITQPMRDACLAVLEKDHCSESLYQSVNRLEAELRRRKHNAHNQSDVWSLYTQDGPDYLV